MAQQDGKPAVAVEGWEERGQGTASGSVSGSRCTLQGSGPVILLFVHMWWEMFPELRSVPVGPPFNPSMAACHQAPGSLQVEAALPGPPVSPASCAPAAPGRLLCSATLSLQCPSSPCPLETFQRLQIRCPSPGLPQALSPLPPLSRSTGWLLAEGRGRLFSSGLCLGSDPSAASPAVPGNRCCWGDGPWGHRPTERGLLTESSSPPLPAAAPVQQSPECVQWGPPGHRLPGGRHQQLLPSRPDAEA